MRIGELISVGACVGALALVACNGDKKSEPGAGGAQGTGSGDGRVLAKVGDTSITVTDFQEQINRQSPFVRARYQDVDKRKEFLDDLVKREAMAQEAIRKGYDKNPDVVQTLKKVMVQKLIREEFDAQFKQTELPDSELQAYYDGHPDEFHQPEMARVSHIRVADKAKAEALLKELKAVPNDYNAFREKAKTESSAEDKVRGGDLQYLSKEDLAKELGEAAATAAFAIEKVGDLAGPVQGKDGWELLKLSGKRREISRTFDQVKNQIRSRIMRDKRTTAYDAYVAELVKKASVAANYDLLAEVKVEPGKAAPHGGGEDGDPHRMFDAAAMPKNMIRSVPRGGGPALPPAPAPGAGQGEGAAE